MDPQAAVTQQMLQLMQMLANTQQLQVTNNRNTNPVDRDATNVVKFSGDGGVMPQTFIRDCNLVFTTKAEAGQPQSDKQKILYAVNHTLSTAHDWAATWYHSTASPATTWVLRSARHSYSSTSLSTMSLMRSTSCAA